MSHDSDITEAALLIALGQRARLRLLEPELLEAALRDTSGAELRALRERVSSHEGLAWLSDALVPLSAARQERILQLAETAFGVEQPRRAGQPRGAERPGRAGKTRPADVTRRGFWAWLLVPAAAAAALAGVLAWPRAEAPPHYAVELRLGDYTMMSSAKPATGRRVSRGSLLQLVLRPPAMTRRRPALLLFASMEPSGDDSSLRHVPVDVEWFEDGSARIRTNVSHAFPSQHGPARLLLVAAPEGTTAEEVIAELRGERSWPETWLRRSRPETWLRQELPLDVVP